MKPWLMTYPEGRSSIEYYRRFAASFGAEVRIPTRGEPPPDPADAFAGLFLPGGGDVEPARYGAEVAHEKTDGISRERDALELDLIPRFIAAGRPVVGICRGLQILVAHFGGRLAQHVPDLVPEAVEVHRVLDGYDASHPLRVDAATRLGSALSGVGETNSSHHQAMDPASPPRLLRIAATSPAGIVEAVECFDFAAPIVAVQWHPERLPDGHPARERLVSFLHGLLI
ncbi:MAG: gamma-glutamyl-gamma-aminobutyrate hydrolase family protein [Kiritimatiellia bacterium]